MCHTLEDAAPHFRIRTRHFFIFGRHFAAHNEDVDVTYNRYGYDTAAWYHDRGIPLAEVGPIPSAPYESQFCVAELWHR